MPDFFPRGDRELLAWTTNFVRGVGNATPHAAIASARSATFIGQAEAIEAAHGRFAEAMGRMRAADTRTASSRATKEAARAELMALIRPVARQLRGYPDVTDTTLIELGLRPRREGKAARLPVPAEAPIVRLIEAAGRTVAVQLRGSTARRGKPRGVANAAWYTTLDGDALDPRWRYGGTTARTTLRFEVDAAVPLGARLRFVAHWQNPCCKGGPPSQVLSITVGGGTTLLSPGPAGRPRLPVAA